MTTTGQIEMVQLSDLICHMHRKGVRLWAEGGRLRYEAPKGALTEGDMERLRAYKQPIVAFIEHTAMMQGAEIQLARREHTDYIPLAHSQLSHWNLYNLGERRHVRQIASATRIQGRLDVSALRASIDELIHQHEALRTRIILLNGIPFQQALDSLPCDFELDDLTGMSSDYQEAEVNRLIRQTALRPVDVTTDRLFNVRILRLGDNDHVLIIAMEHLISDGISRNILLRDVATIYHQLSSEYVVSLPELPIQFADYAVWQQKNDSWIKRCSDKWAGYLAECPRLHVSDRVNSGEPSPASEGWGAVPIQISSKLKAELVNHSRSRGTTLAMTVFAAFVAVVLRWCRATEGVFRYQTHGRVFPEAENAIGFFATALHLRIALGEGCCIGDLATLIAEEYSNAYQHFDFGRAEAQVPRPEFAKNSSFNWVPSGMSSNVRGQHRGRSVTWSSIVIGYPLLKILRRDTEPVLLLFDGDGGVDGHILSSFDALTSSGAERLARNFHFMMATLLRSPDARIADIELV